MIFLIWFMSVSVRVQDLGHKSNSEFLAVDARREIRSESQKDESAQERHN